MAKYYTVATREDDGKWYPQFGDYELDVAAEEAFEMTQSGYAKRDVKVVTTADDSQAAIDAKLARL